MLKNYVLTAWRNLVRSRVYSLIAICGLSIGLAVSILLFWGANDELIYDRGWPEGDRIYRLNATVKMGDNAFDTWTNTPVPIAALALRSYPDIEKAARFAKAGKQVATAANRLFVEKNPVYTEPAFFELFHLSFLSGNANTAFTNPNGMVLSRDGAVKYFGSVDQAIGKTLLVGEKQDPYIVSAVIENMPVKSELRLDMLLSLDAKRKTFRGNGDWKTMDEDWGNFSVSTFFLLKKGADIPRLEKELTAAHLKNNHYVKEGGIRYLLQPLNTLRLYNADMSANGIRIVRLFILIGLLILLIAVINYVNLSTARATKRAREVGLRKVVGASRKQLLAQFLVEFVMIFIASLILCMALLPLLAPIYQQISGKSYRIDYWDADTLKIIGLVALATILTASLYPAWLLTWFNPIEALKTNYSRTAKGGFLRKLLVVIQFSFSIILIICTLVVSKQLHFIQTKQLGFDRENVFTVELGRKTGKQLPAILHELKSNRDISDVSFASDKLLNLESSTDNIQWPGKPAGIQAKIGPMDVAYNFTTLMKLQFADGDGFTGAPADSGYYLVNEAAVKEMALPKPVGTLIELWGRPGQIKGVLKDFNNVSLKEAVQPAIFQISQSADWGGTLYVKTRPGKAREAVEATEKTCRAVDKIMPFEYHFLDDDFDAMYRREAQTASLFKSFAIVAILLSCLGLFGLAVFTVERRTKEIGIRKVLGANVRDVSLLISMEFGRLVIIANIIAWPVSWYAMHKWIEDFAYRTSISWWIFLGAGLVALLLAMVTVISQAMKAAWVNPVISLRME